MTDPGGASFQPEVSVVVPTRNRRSLLARTLASVLAQRDVDFEVIVIDEGSTDDTRAMVSRIADPRLRLIHHPVALGKSAARNRGIAEAAAPWLAFVDDDDLWSPTKLVRQLKAARATDRMWVY